MDWLCAWEFTPTEEEFKAAINAAEPRDLRVWVRPALCFVLSVLCAVDFFTGRRDNPMMLGLALLALVVGVVAAVLPVYLRNKDAKDNASPDRVVKMYLFEGRIAFDHPADQRPVEVLRLVDGGDVYAVMLSPHSYVCLPKRVLREGEEALLLAQFAPKTEGEEV